MHIIGLGFTDFGLDILVLSLIKTLPIFMLFPNVRDETNMPA